MSPRPFDRILLLASACIALPCSAPAQESQARFDAPLVVADARERFEALADMNADGWMDALSVWWDGVQYASCHLDVYLNDQTGKLVASDFNLMNITPAMPQAVAPWNIATADLDGDGLPEVLLGIGSQVKVFRSQGAGAVLGWLPLDVSGIVKGVLIADYDQDGAPDVAVLHGLMTLYHVDPATLAFTPFSEIQTGVVNASLFPAEVNGDGVPDLLVSDADNVSLYPVVGGQIQGPFIIPHQCVDPKPQAGDIDGDGDEDIIVFDITTYTVLRRNGPTGWYTPEYGHVGGTARFLYDLDGDGDLDGVCCGGGGGGPTQVFNTLASSWRMSFNDGQGNFSVSLELPGLGSFRLAGAADLDHDGDLDLVAGRTVFYAHGPWSHVAAKTQLSDPWPSQLCDFDGDADIDLALRTDGVRRNSSDSRTTPFVPRVPTAPAGWNWSNTAYVGDFDGDGAEDMVVARWPTGGGLVTMNLLLNEGGGSFFDAGDAAPAGISMTVANAWPEEKISLTADFDMDGDVDIVAAGDFNATTKTWANDGSGHFTLTSTLPMCFAQVVADFNGDGIPDIAGRRPPWVGATIDSLGTWKGLGNGAFTAGPTFGVSLESERGRLAVGDLDGDGDLDIVAGDYNDQLRVLWNNLSSGVTDMGVGQFTSTTIVTGQLGNSSCATVCDVNGDGRMDIVMNPSTIVGFTPMPNYALVFLRKGDNSGFEPPVTQVIRATAVADMDGDGDLDAVGSHVWLNTRVSGPAASACHQSETGTPDASGMTPTLGGKGPFQVGHPVDLRVTGAPPQTNGFLLKVNGAFAPESPFTSTVLGFGPSRLYKVVPIHTSGVAGFSGTGSWTLPFTVPGYLSNETRSYVAVFPDPAAPGHQVRSNEFTVHHAP
jgi:hypothetical protein